MPQRSWIETRITDEGFRTMDEGSRTMDKEFSISLTAVHHIFSRSPTVGAGLRFFLRGHRKFHGTRARRRTMFLKSTNDQSTSRTWLYPTRINDHFAAFTVT